MKKWLLALIFLPLSIGLKAQSNIPHPFPTDSAAWVDYYSRDDGWGNYYSSSTLFITNGDTLLNNVSYTKICEHFYPTNSNYLTSVIRVDSNKVFVRHYDGVTMLFDPEIVLYDYNLQIGDSFSITGIPISFQCILIDSALTNTGYRKQWNLLTDYECQSMSGFDTLRWIEGATSNVGFMYDLFIQWCGVPDITDVSFTQCFRNRDTMVLGNGNCLGILNSITDNPTQANIALFPNPATADFTVKSNNPTQNLTVQLYNSLGQQVGSYSGAGNQLTIPRNGLPSGVYIAQIQSGRGVARQKVLFTN
jgi:hypothetical protein